MNRYVILCRLHAKSLSGIYEHIYFDDTYYKDQWYLVSNTCIFYKLDYIIRVRFLIYTYY